MKLCELFQKNQLNELRYLETEHYGGWITPKNEVHYVSSAGGHGDYLEDRGMEWDDYVSAYKKGYVRFVTKPWASTYKNLNLEGNLDNIKRTFRIWWPTARQATSVMIDSSDGESYDFKIPEQLSDLRQQFGPLIKKESTQLNELKEYLDPHEYGAWVNAKNKQIDGVSSHEEWLYNKYGDYVYDQAFADGWVRFVNNRYAFDIQGYEDDIRKTFKIWWPSAVQSEMVFIDNEKNKSIGKYNMSKPKERSELRDRFGPQSKKINEKIEQLPPDVIKAFVNLGEKQRGAPEHAMLKVQHLMGGGVLNPVVEHTGDLTHRMSHMAQYGNMGHEFVKEKTERILKYLKRPYGFEKEFNENIKNNAPYKGFNNPEDFKNKISNALKNYAKEHSKLPVYNKMQWLAREAAVAIGEQDWNMAEKYIEALDNYASNRERFDKEASKFYKDNSGSLVQYKPSMKENIIKEEKITQAAFKDPKTGKIYPTGLIHDMETIMKEFGFDPDIEDDWERFTPIYNTLVHGFITDKGRFFNRKQAAELTDTSDEELRTEFIKGFGPNPFWKRKGVDPEIKEGEESLTDNQLKAIEEKLDRLWSALGIDVEFSKHWKERVNDPRNRRQITAEEIIKLFNEAYKAYGKRIAQAGPDFEAVFKDISTDINIPFVLKWDRDKEELDLVAKTIMRKDPFVSKDPEFKVGLTSKKKVNESPVWDLSGYWITDDGRILEVDHKNDIHHKDLAFDEFAEYIDLSDFESDKEAREDEHIIEEVLNTALDNGWIQVTTSTNEFGVFFNPSKVSNINIKKLINLVRKDQDYDRYVASVGLFHQEYFTKRDFLRHLRQYLT